MQSQGRTVAVQVRMKPSEKRMLEKLARKHELRVSELVRFWVRKESAPRLKPGARARVARRASRSYRAAR